MEERARQVYGLTPAEIIYRIALSYIFGLGTGELKTSRRFPAVEKA